MRPDVAADVAAQPDQYHDWRTALATNSRVPFETGNPKAGFYRVRDRNTDRSIRWDAVAIWYDDDGIQCARTGPRSAPAGSDEIEALFAQCNADPISHEQYLHIADGGRWPDEIEPIAATTADVSQHEAVDHELTALREQAKKWITAIGSVKTKEDADKSANYADAFAKIEKRAGEMHKAEKAPHLEAGRTVDAVWKPIIERADECKTWAKKAAEAFLIAEKRRLDEEDRRRFEEAARIEKEAMRARVEAARIGAPPPVIEPPPMAAPPAKAKAGTTGRAISVRTRTVVEITDWRAFLTWLATQNDLPDDFRAAVEKHARRLIDAGMNPPGVATKTIEEVA
jgi:hypothetical protein